MNIPNPTHAYLVALRRKLLATHDRLLDSDDWIAHPVTGETKSWISLPNDGSIPIVRAESVIRCSAQRLFDYLVTDIDTTCKEWNDVMIYSGKIKDYGDGFELSRIISEGYVVADREDVFIRSTLALDNGNLLELSVGLGEEEVPVYKEISSYTQRSLMHFASKEICPIDSGACLYKTIWHYDPAGWLRKVIPRKILGNMILKNLIHEHKKLAAIFGQEGE